MTTNRARHEPSALSLPFIESWTHSATTSTYLVLSAAAPSRHAPTFGDDRPRAVPDLRPGTGTLPRPQFPSGPGGLRRASLHSGSGTAGWIASVLHGGALCTAPRYQLPELDPKRPLQDLRL